MGHGRGHWHGREGICGRGQWSTYGVLTMGFNSPSLEGLWFSPLGGFGVWIWVWWFDGLDIIPLRQNNRMKDIEPLDDLTSLLDISYFASAFDPRPSSFLFKISMLDLLTSTATSSFFGVIDHHGFHPPRHCRRLFWFQFSANFQSSSSHPRLSMLPCGYMLEKYLHLY